MEEQLLQFIWHRKLFDSTALTTTTGESIAILHTGTPNHDQGPDFLLSRIKVGEQIWAGHVEIHIRSSAWYLHMHEQDAHYNNVILHVVWQEDRAATTADGYRIPCLELSTRVDTVLLDRYRHLMNNEEWVPCGSSLMSVSAIVRTSWLERMMAERLEQKTEAVLRILHRCTDNWEQTFYMMMTRQLGAPVNSEAMETLSANIPLSLLRKYMDRQDQMEAILFGAAGMLGRQVNHPYVYQLNREFDFLKNKYGIKPMAALQWKFLRMRPASFPTLRIAQLTSIIVGSDHFVSHLENRMSGAEWVKFFSVAPMHDFWKEHYHFTLASSFSEKPLGKTTSHALVINVVAPFMFVYGKHLGKPHLKDDALMLLEDMSAERNSIITGWNQLGWEASNAGQTQAMLQLKKSYCDHRRCLHCAIGLQVIR